MTRVLRQVAGPEPMSVRARLWTVELLASAGLCALLLAVDLIKTTEEPKRM